MKFASSIRVKAGGCQRPVGLDRSRREEALASKSARRRPDSETEASLRASVVTSLALTLFTGPSPNYFAPACWLSPCAISTNEGTRQVSTSPCEFRAVSW